MNNIINNDRFLKCGGKMLCELLAGSRLYGLSTVDSDWDYRGVFLATHKHHKAGFKIIETITQLSTVDGVDSQYYELSHFFKLIYKSNMQSLEMLFADDDAFLQLSPVFREIRKNRMRLIDTEYLKKSLFGYIQSEIKLAFGANAGRLGGKRKTMVDKFGFSPKNVVQLLRLIEVGSQFYKNGTYPVNIKTHNNALYEVLINIKTHPINYNKTDLFNLINSQVDDLKETIDDSTIKFEFDLDFASELILNIKKEYENELK